ncbi:DUF3293 domain-containing protein [Fulvimonas soli]|uniref:Uncharacterized protein DUF3293 n=1 Tax=Fulvimonas soli TaxID=155197 RepID=A0A316IK82_9GAMM|nr:DUF3293 domain-containing protein [Fulvimonas soli]PWK92924.1 uncharacterized protein DUF3293 [Fulvimonas soli]TNY26594.1 hypothetical protein BV497_08135 [Fulvimonas soli]
MDEALAADYRAADYLAWVEPAEWARLAPDRPLPPALQAVVGEAAWGFVTACNPRSERCTDEENRAAQRELLAALRRHPATVRVLPAIGLGGDGWHEPSLFVVGPDTAALDALMRRFGQHAYLHGRGDAPARLRWTPPAG